MTAKHDSEIRHQAHKDAASIKDPADKADVHKRLQDDISKEQSMSAADRKVYHAALTQELTKRKLLPELDLVLHKSAVSKSENAASEKATAKSSSNEHVVKRGETVWSIAKDELGEGASNKQIAERVKQIAADNGLTKADKIKEGIPLKIGQTAEAQKDVAPPKQGTKTSTQADGGIVVESADGTKTTTYHGDNGDTVKVEKKDGTGYVKSPDRSEHHWGPAPEDNYDVPKGEANPKVLVENNRTTTVWSDDKGSTVKVENKDGTGFVKYPDGSVHHWGPNASDNYDRAADGTTRGAGAGGAEVSVSQDGTKTTTWRGENGDTVKVERKDGSGFVKNPDNSEHHWGKAPEDNYDVPAGNQSPRTLEKDGNVTTVWSDAKGTTVKVENKDGTGFVRYPDGSVHHWGPNAADNYDKDKDGSRANKRADGSEVVVSADGTTTTTWKGENGVTVKVENKDGTGYVKNPDNSEHHWGPSAIDNYDVPGGVGNPRTLEQASSTTTVWTDSQGKSTVKVENKNGTGFVKYADGSVHHWGPSAADNYDIKPNK